MNRWRFTFPERVILSFLGIICYQLMDHPWGFVFLFAAIAYPQLGDGVEAFRDWRNAKTAPVPPAGPKGADTREQGR